MSFAFLCIRIALVYAQHVIIKISMKFVTLVQLEGNISKISIMNKSKEIRKTISNSVFVYLLHTFISVLYALIIVFRYRCSFIDHVSFHLPFILRNTLHLVKNFLRFGKEEILGIKQIMMPVQIIQQICNVHSHLSLSLSLSLLSCSIFIVFT